MFGQRVVGLVVVIGVVIASAVVGGQPASGDEPRYTPPVMGVIVDHFRPPPSPFAAGNRGLDYRVTPLSPVRAAADGEVIFAGQVGGALHVTIRHADGLRSSYSFLASIDVRMGRLVKQGDVLGLTGEAFHFGMRDGADQYLDPEALFVGAPAVAVHLVPSGDDGAEPAAGDAGAGAESPWLLGVVGERWAALDAITAQAVGVVGEVVGGVRRSTGFAASAFARRLRFWAHNAYESRVGTHAHRVVAAVTDWYSTRRRCTPESSMPPGPGRRRIVVEVAGLGSTSEDAAVTEVHTGELGYAPDDVIRFSYNGGRVPVEGLRRDGLAVTTYTARDSQGDLFAAGRRLRELIDVVSAANPGVPIDVIAHSQGGVVARLALEERRAVGLAPVVTHLVTLGTPHEGADLASLVEAMGQTAAGDDAITIAQRALGLDLDPHLPAGHQLAATSPVIEVLRAHPPPPRVRVTSIAARGDLVVPAGRTVIEGPNTEHTTVPLVGVHAHDRLPGSSEATREIALALADQPPRCRGLGTVLTDAAVAEGISWAEAMLAHAAPGS